MTEKEKEDLINEQSEEKHNKESAKKEKNLKKEQVKNKENSLNDEVKKVLKEENSKLKAENEELKKKLEEKHNDMLRIVADYENLKKRLYKDMENRLKFANSSLIKDLLPVIDHLEMALTHAKDQTNVEALYEGVNLTLKQLKGVLEKYGLKDIEINDNQSFDPTYHEAMMLDYCDDKDNNVVTKVLQKGYFMHGEVLRPAKVAVNKKDNYKKEEENGK